MTDTKIHVVDLQGKNLRQRLCHYQRTYHALKRLGCYDGLWRLGVSLFFKDNFYGHC